MRLISIPEIQELLQEIDPDVVVNADRLQSQGIITTWNSDDDVASSHFLCSRTVKKLRICISVFLS